MNREWSNASPCDPQRAFERRDGARVELVSADKPYWVAKFPGEYLKAADQRAEFGSSDEAIAALDRASTPAQSVLGEARLLSAAKLLFANSLACVEQHHGRDTASNGLPGWLADAKADIEAASQPQLAGDDARLHGTGFTRQNLDGSVERIDPRDVFIAAAPSQPAPVCGLNGWKFEDHENGVVYVRAPSGKHVAIGYMAPARKDCTDILRELIIAHLQASASPQPDRESEDQS